ncbi:MAG TPA: VWA domain-containing protein [Vicinamibacterales bacterium]
MMNRLRSLSIAVLSLVAVATPDGQQSSGQSQDAFRFKSGVELVNVTATVADSNGRFVPGLTRDDFIVYEDDVRQAVSQFSAERVPVSLGIALDTSGSMAGEKIDAARGALDRFLSDLLDEHDEVFVYRFSDTPVLLHGWTADKGSMARVLDRVIPEGGTALYDAVSDAVPMAARGKNQKKAIVIISDGNDTSSHIGMRELKQQIRQSEVLVYAVGIDSDADDSVRRPPTQGIPRRPPPTPFPFPPGRRPGGRFPIRPQIFGGNGGSRSWPGDERVNVVALRDMTDDSGGRTEIVRYPRDIDPATASIADELSKQYYLGYSPTTPKDGRWHAIRVELRNGSYRVRARKGYIAN